MKIYNLKKLTFGNNVSDYPEPGTLVKCRGQIGICYTYTVCSDGVKCKVYLLGADDFPYITVDYSYTACKEIDPPAGYTIEYGKRLCEAWSCNPHRYTPEGIVYRENK